jgi:hypothetical protein
MQVFADDSDPMTFPRPGSRYNIPVDKNRSPKVGGFQGKVPNSVAAVTLKAMDLPEIREGFSLQEIGVMVPRKSRTTRTWRSFTSPAELLRLGHGWEISGWCVAASVKNPYLLAPRPPPLPYQKT